MFSYLISYVFFRYIDNYFNTCRECHKPIMTHQQRSLRMTGTLNNEKKKKRQQQKDSKSIFIKIDKILKIVFCYGSNKKWKKNNKCKIEEVVNHCKCSSLPIRKLSDSLITTVNFHAEPSSYDHQNPTGKSNINDVTFNIDRHIFVYIDFSTGHHWIFRTGWTPHPNLLSATTGLCDNCHERVHKDSRQCPHCGENVLFYI
ncbi:uncharacterized protein BX663DRAFT_509546 [Cokeromyces recurvatus]|uniref:uncharacterized protein n=1 Tax=Cokeromyces recurvatus TaxID=90255 RepID=UPI00221F7A8C|nr:uncharacterized protein BX663DRAFT_509546 [Cokeromyces recurvatus]KAI7903098.1 hypothetical protein BX663DRAFT_509546 [Cokeromyces recurvatus]